MSWTLIDDGLCSRCGICTQICAGCYHMEDDKVISHANARTCVQCGKCVGICPEGAIVHEKMDMANFPPVAGRKLVDTADFVQFIRERRAHRIFKNKPISQADLELLVDTMRYAPTGHNAMGVDLIVVQQPERVKQLSDLTVDFQVAGLEHLKKDIEKAKNEGMGQEHIASLEGRAGFMNMIIDMRASGKDPIFYNAPAVLIFHSTTKVVTPKDDCVIAATTVGLLARTIGLETTYIAMFEFAANAYPPLQKALNLPQGHKVFSVLVVGYPLFSYRTVVDRRPRAVRWE